MRKRILLMTTTLAALGAAAPALAQELGYSLDAITLGSALRDDRAILDTPVSVTVREGEDLEKLQAGNFEELIGDIPGLTIIGGPRAVSQTPNIRGFDDNQLVLRIDGGRFNFSQAHRGRFLIDPELVQRVEVVKGGGSTLYGSGAMGGVISIETRDVADLLQDGQTMGARLGFGFEDNGHVTRSSAAIYGDWGDFDGLVYLSDRRYHEDPVAGEGVELEFSDIDQINGLIKLGFEPNADSRIELSIARYQDSGQIPANSSAEGSLDPSASNPVVDRDATSTSYRLSWDYAPEGSDTVDLSVLVYGEGLEITEDLVSDTRLDETRYDTWGIEVINRSSLSLGLPVDLVYGFEAFKDTQEGERDGAPRTAFPDAEATTTGIFAEATIDVSEKLDVIAGLRADFYERDANDPSFEDASEQFYSPRIGVSYRPDDNWQVYGNVARAFRAPTLAELYSTGLHFPGGFPIEFNQFGVPIAFAPNNFFVPNPDLKPEESTQFEIGARFENGGVFAPGDSLNVSTSIYYADVTNFIDLDVDVAAGTSFAENVLEAELWGFEAEAAYDAGQWFAGAGLSINRGQSDDGEWLGSIPQDKLTLSGGYRPTEAWEVGARATFAAAQDRVEDEADAADAYTTLDLFATFAPDSGPLAGDVIRFGIDNVTDELYRVYPNGMAQTGRTFKVSATFTF